VTDVNQRNQRNTRESRRAQHQQETLSVRRDGEKVRHAQERNEDRRGRKLDYEIEKRRANNEYLVHERMGRRTRSNRGCNRVHKVPGDHSLEQPSKARSFPEDLRVLHDRERVLRGSKLRKPDASDPEQRVVKDESRARRSRAVEQHGTREKRQWRDVEMIRNESVVRNESEGIGSEPNQWQKANRSRRYPKIEDFRTDDALGRSSAVDPNNSWTSSTLQVQDDYFGDYLESESLPQKRSESLVSRSMTYKDLLRMKRELEEKDEDAPEKREKRNEDESRCSSEVTTLTVGCSTADRMEFQSDCLDDDAITGNYLPFLSLYRAVESLVPRWNP